MTQTAETRPRTAKAIVARGRSIEVPVDGAKITVGLTEDGKPITRAACQTFREFQEVLLPIEEIVSLRQLGYLVDPDNQPPPVQDNGRPYN